jgi:hypothetical protein
MPLLAVPPQATLVWADDDDGDRTEIYLTEPDEAAATAQIVVNLILAPRGVPEIADVDGLAAALAQPDDEDDDGAALSVWRVVLLAVTGRHERAGQLADALLAVDDVADRAERQRLVRQLHRWLAAGAPPPPPVEQTLAALPPEPTRPISRSGIAFRRARQNSRNRAAAWGAARSAASGKSTEELHALLAHEYALRGADPRASDLAVGVEMIELDRREYLPHVRAARNFYDEYVRVPAVLTPGRRGLGPVLELERPAGATE